MSFILKAVKRSKVILTKSHTEVQQWCLCSGTAISPHLAAEILLWKGLIIIFCLHTGYLSTMMIILFNIIANTA